MIDMNKVNESMFVGYDKLEVNTTVIGLLKDMVPVTNLNDEGWVVLKKTPFYAESGGQIADTGFLIGKDFKLEVIDVKKDALKQHLHKVKVINGKVTINDSVRAKIDIDKRKAIARNHTAAHIIHKVLQEMLNDPISQAGAKIYDQFLHMDFSYAGKLDNDKIIQIEKTINNKLKQDKEVKTQIMRLEEAKKKGITLAFEGRYADIVRVINIDDTLELCGGTHVSNIKDIQKIAIMAVEAKGSNIYRIIAATANHIEPQFKKAIFTFEIEKEKLLTKANNILKEAESNNIVLSFKPNIYTKELNCYQNMIDYKASLQDLQIKVKKLEENFLTEKAKKAINDLTLFTSLIEERQGLKTIINKVDNYDTKLLKPIADRLIDEGVEFIFIINLTKDFISFIARAHDSLIGKINCGQIIKKVSAKYNGSGGGNASFAQGGSKDITKVEEMINFVKELVMNIK